jgi:hypothetical protein
MKKLLIALAGLATLASAQADINSLTFCDNIKYSDGNYDTLLIEGGSNQAFITAGCKTLDLQSYCINNSEYTECLLSNQGDIIPGEAIAIVYITKNNISIRRKSFDYDVKLKNNTITVTATDKISR